jgi:hypothetical protein
MVRLAEGDGESAKAGKGRSDRFESRGDGGARSSGKGPSFSAHGGAAGVAASSGGRGTPGGGGRGTRGSAGGGSGDRGGAAEAAGTFVPTLRSTCATLGLPIDKIRSSPWDVEALADPTLAPTDVTDARRERVAYTIEHRSSFRPGALGLSEEEWALLKSVVATQRKRRNASH